MQTTNALLREVANLYTQSQRDTIACCDIQSQTQCMVITELGRNQPMTPLHLANALGYEKSWMSRVINQLLDENWLEKLPNEDDKRSYFLQLTAEGERQLALLNNELNDHADRLMAAIPPEQQECLREALQLLREALYREVNGLVMP